MVSVLLSPPSSLPLLTFLLSRLMPRHSSVKYVSRQTEPLLKRPPSLHPRRDKTVCQGWTKIPMTSSCLKSAYPSWPVTPPTATKLWPASWTLVKLCPVNFWHLWHPTSTSFWLSTAMHDHFFPAHANARSAHAAHTGPSSGSNTLAPKLTQIRDVLHKCFYGHCLYRQCHRLSFYLEIRLPRPSESRRRKCMALKKYLPDHRSSWKSLSALLCTSTLHWCFHFHFKFIAVAARTKFVNCLLLICCFGEGFPSRFGGK